MSLAALAICISASLQHIIRLIKLGAPVDYSKQAGKISKAVHYSFTKAMSPAKKESAYLHLPTYTAGILYHIGTFLAIPLFFIFLLNFEIPEESSLYIAAFFLLTGISGIGILIKRIVKKKLLSLSNPDDFISNILVTFFQIATAYVLVNADGVIIYSIICSLFLIYLPMGKLKHAYYFFAARYHLGFYYGWRNVWPVSKSKN